jgi:hypothetical protein
MQPYFNFRERRIHKLSGSSLTLLTIAEDLRHIQS